MPVAAGSEHDGPRSKRVRILTVAVEQFGMHGYEHTKWAAVAQEVGIGQTALYHYFESKAHCLLTIMALELSDADARFETIINTVDDPSDALHAAVNAALNGTPTDALQRRVLQNHMHMLAAPRPSAKEEIERQKSRDLVATIAKRWATLIERGQGTGVFTTDIDPSVLARLVLGLLESVWLWYRPEGTTSLDDITTSVADSAIRMVSATDAAERRR